MLAASARRDHLSQALDELYTQGASSAQAFFAKVEEFKSAGAAKATAAAALLEATGIEPAAPVWGAPFREMAALYDGSNPPLEALGVSAKLFSNGKAATARYHTMLELPGSGGHLPRDAQRRAAARRPQPPL